MNKPLDEQFSTNNQQVFLNFWQWLKILSIYALLFATSFILFYAIMEASLFSNPFLRTVVFITLIECLGFVPNHYLQKQLYHHYQGSIIKTSLTPILGWLLLLLLLTSLNFNLEFSNMDAWYFVLMRLGYILSWYASLCWMVAWYFQHQNKFWYAACIIVHGLLYLTLYHLLHTILVN